MEAMCITTLTRNGACKGNYRLLGEPVQLMIRTTQVLEVPGFDLWEDDGGAVAPPPHVETVAQANKVLVGIRGARRQRAARAAVPRESIKVVPLPQQPAPVEVVIARYEGRSDEDVKVAALEARIKELLGVVERPKILAQRKAEAIERLEQLFNVERKVR